MYKIREIESGKYVKTFHDDGEYEICITEYPYVKRINKKKMMKKMIDKPEKATEECISILVNEYEMDEDWIRNERGNIYCPFHENKKKSKSPSARFRVSMHSYSCYSSHCPLKNRRVSSVELLSTLKRY